MRLTQITDPHELRKFILLHQYFLRLKFPDAKITSKRGKPRIDLRWAIVAICVFARVNNIVWRDLPSNLRLCDFLIEEGFLLKTPCKSTFHGYWDLIKDSNLDSWIQMSGDSLTSHEDTDLAIDSSGFELMVGSIWILVKWDKELFSKHLIFSAKYISQLPCQTGLWWQLKLQIVQHMFQLHLVQFGNVCISELPIELDVYTLIKVIGVRKL